MPKNSLNTLPPLILASASPRRSELLGRIGVPFETTVSDLHEDEIIERLKRDRPGSLTFKFAKSTALSLARDKALAVLTNRSDCLVIGADTIVTNGKSILGKPYTAEEAVEMLRSLCGRKHRVYTSVCLLGAGIDWEFCSKTTVTFRPLDAYQEALIHRYVSSGSPFDKAGGYGIQDMGALFISKIKGDYYSVVGLPLSELARELYSLGYHPSADRGEILCPD